VPDFLVDGGNLSLRFTADDDEIIGEAGDAARIKEYDVAALFFGGRFNRLTRDLNGFQ